MEDLITVIVLIYNRDKYLHECIESIINQTYKNLEIILVDDGSSDRSLNICKYYERLDNRIKIITQKNQGISMAMENAFKLSKGNYITRCDSDDLNELDRYEKQLKYLKENNLDVIGNYINVFGDIEDPDKEGLEDFLNMPMKDFYDQESKILVGSCIGGGVFFSKASILKKFNPFHKDYLLVEDVYMHIMLHKNNCKLGMLEEILYNYRMHDKNTSIGLNRKKVIEKHLECLFKYFFYDKLLEYENIIIIKREEEESIIKNIFKNNLSNFNPLFINEHSIEDFISNKLNNYKPYETLIIVGVEYNKKIEKALKNKNYYLYNNLFYLADFYY